ncbi:MAG TPA: L-rhamnose mutarotase [Acidimicrobiales bacterium]|nr:L-rhamnose mutarotase [Acidimicrobiales bacterium]
MTQRVCFQLRVSPEHVEEYLRRHSAVWPEMRAALSAAGWHNYSLFLAPPGTVIGYLECEDFEGARRAMEKTEVNARWQKEMAPMFEGLSGRPPDEAMDPLPEIFHLD